MSNIIHLNESELKNQLGKLVSGTVENTLNKLLDVEADKITNACRYEISCERDTQAGYYTRKLMTKAGEVNLKVPKLRKLSFEISIIEPTSVVKHPLKKL